VEDIIYMLNPWWEWRNWEDKDSDLRKLRKAKIKWSPPWIKNISLKPFSLNFITGPRQVGKTTGVKILVKKLLSQTVPKAVFYYNCDFISSSKELKKIIDFYLKIKHSNKINISYIILDEVTGVEYWWKIIKGYIDLGVFENDVLIVLGSASFRLRKFAEAFPGRRGYGTTIEVLPLNFREYIQVHGEKPLKSNYIKVKTLFEKYLNTGGFPRSINEDPEFFKDLIFSIERDIAKTGKSPKIFRMILHSILEKAPSPIGYHTIAQEIGISHNTVREYLELMEDLFIVGVAYWKQGNKISFRKEKKIFLRDPYLAKTFSMILGVDTRKDYLYEWIVQEHLYRKYSEIYYWRNSYEIDCLAGNLKIEVEAGKPHRRYPRGVTVIDEEKLPLFLLDL